MANQIKNIEGYSPAELRGLVSNGGKFVMYKYCISVLLATFNNPTDIYFIHPGNSRITPGLSFLFVNLLLGWWGIPWGPIYTIGNIGSILSGGKDVTSEIIAQINQNDASYGTGTNYNIPGQSNNNNETNTYNIPLTDNNNSGNTYNIPN